MRSPNRLAAAALFGIWFLAFGPMLFADVAPYYRDQLLTFIPIRQYLSERISAFELPQWYPYEALGVPFMGQMVTSTFHPTTLLFLPFDAAVAAKLQTILTYLLALVGAYRAARALPVSRPAAAMGGIAFALGGYALGVSHNPAYLLAHATMPWVLWAALRLCVSRAPRHAALLAVCWALVLLAGDAQSFLLCALLVASAPLVLRTDRRTLGLGVGAGVVASLLVCVELLPAFEISRDSIRVLGKSDPLLGRIFSFHPLRAFELFIPNPIPDELRVDVTTPLFHDGGSLWATTIFAGVCVLLCAAFGLTRRRPAFVFGGLFVLCAWLASGSHGLLLELLWKIFPLLSQFRFPEKYLGPAWVFLSMLAALGFDAALEKPKRAALAGGAVALALGLGALAVDAMALPARVFLLTNNGLVPSLEIVTATADAWRSGALRSAGFAALFAALAFVTIKRPKLALVLPLVAAGELILANLPHLPMADRALISEPTEFTARIKERAQKGARVVSLSGGRAKRTVTGGDLGWLYVMRQLLRADESGRHGISSLGFNLPATSLRAWRALGANAGYRAQVGHLYGACFRIDDVGASTSPPIAVEAEASLQLAMARCRPRVYVGPVVPAADDKAAVSALRAGLNETSIWEGGPALSGAGTATLEVDEPEQLIIAVSADAPAALIINDQFAKGWTATVDGKPAPIFPANVTVRGVPVEAGQHKVELLYRTPSLGAGAALSLLGVLAVALTLFLGRPREKK